MTGAQKEIERLLDHWYGRLHDVRRDTLTKCITAAMRWAYADAAKAVAIADTSGYTADLAERWRFTSAIESRAKKQLDG